MAKLPAYRAAPGAIADAALTNTMFTDVGVATADIDAANVRSQAVDVAQMATVTVQNAGSVTRFATEHLDSGPYTLSDGASRVVSTWNASLNPAVVRVGDVLRLYPSFRATAVTWHTSTVATLESAVLGIGAGWLFWLEWDITDATLTSWAGVPGQGVFSTSHYANVNDHAGAAIPHIPTNETPSGMVVPHVYVQDATLSPFANVFNYMTGAYAKPLRRSRAYHYSRSSGGGPLSVYGVRLMCRGVVALGRDPGGSGDGLLFVRDTALNATDAPFNSDTITVDNIMMDVIVQAAS